MFIAWSVVALWDVSYFPGKPWDAWRQELPQRLAQPGAAQKLRERLLEELRKEGFISGGNLGISGIPPKQLKWRIDRDAHII